MGRERGMKKKTLAIVVLLICALFFLGSIVYTAIKWTEGFWVGLIALAIGGIILGIAEIVGWAYEYVDYGDNKFLKILATVIKTLFITVCVAGGIFIIINLWDVVLLALGLLTCVAFIVWALDTLRE